MVLGQGMNDLTIIYYTANRIPEDFADNIRDNILQATKCEIPIISVSQKPLAFGDNICIGEVGPSTLGVYRQVLIGAKEAKTGYVALCEDDTLYHPSHFKGYRPSNDIFGYNHNKWYLFAWERNPIFSAKADRSVLSQCIAPRKLLIEALEERFSKTYTEDRIKKHFGEMGRYERWLGVTIRQKEPFFSQEPNIIVCHGNQLSYDHFGSRRGHGDIRVKEVPPWGKAEDVLLKYFGEGNWNRQQKRDGHEPSHEYKNLKEGIYDREFAVNRDTQSSP